MKLLVVAVVTAAAMSSSASPSDATATSELAASELLTTVAATCRTDAPSTSHRTLLPQAAAAVPPPLPQLRARHDAPRQPKKSVARARGGNAPFDAAILVGPRLSSAVAAATVVQSPPPPPLPRPLLPPRAIRPWSA